MLSYLESLGYCWSRKLESRLMWVLQDDWVKQINVLEMLVFNSEAIIVIISRIEYANLFAGLTCSSSRALAVPACPSSTQTNKQTNKPGHQKVPSSKYSYLWIASFHVTLGCKHRYVLTLDARLFHLPLACRVVQSTSPVVVHNKYIGSKSNERCNLSIPNRQ